MTRVQIHHLNLFYAVLFAQVRAIFRGLLSRSAPLHLEDLLVAIEGLRSGSLLFDSFFQRSYLTFGAVKVLRSV